MHFNCSSDEHAMSESAYARINPYMYMYLHRSSDEHAMSESAYTRINPYMYLHRSSDEHAVTASAYARIICMYELLTIIKMEDPTDV